MEGNIITNKDKLNTVIKFFEQLVQNENVILRGTEVCYLVTVIITYLKDISSDIEENRMSQKSGD